MKRSTLILALVSGLAMPLAAAAETSSQPAAAPGYDVAPLEQKYQQQQMSDRAMRLGAEGSAGATMFDRLDTNMDGAISKQEADKSSTVNRDFGTLDTNQDGAISREEWKAGGQ